MEQTCTCLQDRQADSGRGGESGKIAEEAEVDTIHEVRKAQFQINSFNYESESPKCSSQITFNTERNFCPFHMSGHYLGIP